MWQLIMLFFFKHYVPSLSVRVLMLLPAAGAPPVGIGAGTVITRAIIGLGARIGRNCVLVNTQGKHGGEEQGAVFRSIRANVPSVV